MGGQIRGALFNFLVVKKCPFLYLLDADLKNNPCKEFIYSLAVVNFKKYLTFSLTISGVK